MLLFGKWDASEVVYEDISLENYISISNISALPHTAGRWQKKRFAKGKCPIVERLTNSLMMHGRNAGKKVMAARIVEQAFDIIYLCTKENPIQVLVKAVENTGAREDSTRIGSGGAVRRTAVDVSPLRRVSQSITLITSGARKQAFQSVRPIQETLAAELINAARCANESYAVNKRVETEHVAVSNR